MIYAEKHLYCGLKTGLKSLLCQGTVAFIKCELISVKCRYGIRYAVNCLAYRFFFRGHCTV